MIKVRKPYLLIIAALVVLGAVAVHAAPIRIVTATITRISDGDTVQDITPEGTKLKVRLYGIDAPETQKGNKLGEPFGNASRDYLASMISQRSVRVEILDIDRYRRMVAILR
ncbi:MAG: thermonuclease family protein [Deltaproteobacteria bacterium]|nr:thermonuclease family protein [Deltaproteobacteria bacterium]